MAVLDIFSKRQKRLRGEVHDTYRYDNLPQALRVQIVQIVEEVTDRLHGGLPYDGRQGLYEEIAGFLRREYGVFRLAASRHADEREDVLEFVLKEESVERVLDVVECPFDCVSRELRVPGSGKRSSRPPARSTRDSANTVSASSCRQGR